ncbi:MAG: acyl-CoA thioesterase [Melioribacteraceae bacterium]|nr:acyl-CoA thioesterase [Melioribacteraceae bacterium]
MRDKNIPDKSLFNHRIEQQVKFHEVDLLGVCNNAVYFNYFEDARLDYVTFLKEKYNLPMFEEENFFIMVHNHCDYFQSAHLNDKLIIRTRLSFVKKSSFGFEHIVELKDTGEIIAKGGGVVVHYHKTLKKAIPLPEEFYSAAKDFEKEVSILF